MKFDLLIKNGTIVDGTNQDCYQADIGIKNDKICAIGTLTDCDSYAVLDADGKYVTPGFIDIHTHADSGLPLFPQAESFVNQGVTTVVASNCGLGVFPLKDKWYFQGPDTQILNQLHPNLPELFDVSYDLDTIKGHFKTTFNRDINWLSMEDYFSHMEAQGFSINLYPLTPHTNIREIAMGKDCFRSATDTEIKVMQDLLRKELEHGSNGLSTGLFYGMSPKINSVFAETKELIALAKTLTEYTNKSFFTHVRYKDMTSESSPFDTIGGLKEALSIAEQTGCRLNISHINACIYEGDSEVSSAQAGQEILSLVDTALTHGIDVSFDVTPIHSGDTFHIPQLLTMFRPILEQYEGINHFITCVQDISYHASIYPHAKELFEYADFIIHRCIGRSEYEGFYLSELCKRYQKSKADLVLELIYTDIDTRIISTCNRYTALAQELLQHPLAIPSSDANCYDYSYSMKLNEHFIVNPHPGHFNASVTYLTNYGFSRFEDTIYKLTGLPATRLGLSDRGTIKIGHYADLLILDKDHLRANIDYHSPHKSPDGIDYVIINGQITSKYKQHTGVLAGKFLT